MYVQYALLSVSNRYVENILDSFPRETHNVSFPNLHHNAGIGIGLGLGGTCELSERIIPPRMKSSGASVMYVDFFFFLM